MSLCLKLANLNIVQNFTDERAWFEESVKYIFRRLRFFVCDRQFWPKPYV